MPGIEILRFSRGLMLFNVHVGTADCGLYEGGNRSIMHAPSVNTPFERRLNPLWAVNGAVAAFILIAALLIASG